MTTTSSAIARTAPKPPRCSTAWSAPERHLLRVPPRGLSAVNVAAATMTMPRMMLHTLIARTLAPGAFGTTTEIGAASCSTSTTIAKPAPAIPAAAARHSGVTASGGVARRPKSSTASTAHTGTTRGTKNRLADTVKPIADTVVPNEPRKPAPRNWMIMGNHCDATVEAMSSSPVNCTPTMPSTTTTMLAATAPAMASPACASAAIHGSLAASGDGVRGCTGAAA